MLCGLSRRAEQHEPFTSKYSPDRKWALVLTEAIADASRKLFDCEAAGNGSDMLFCEQHKETCKTAVASAYDEVLQTRAGGVNIPNR